MVDLLRTEHILQSNLNNMFAILMSLCDSDMKSHVENCSDYTQMDDDLDTIKLLGTIDFKTFANSVTNMWQLEECVMS